MFFSTLQKLFRQGNVSVSGNCGSGKDLMFSNVAVRSKGYVANIDYGGKGKYTPIDFNALDCGKNTYADFISGNIKPYKYPYPIGHDIFITDCGVYFPSQYCNELNKKYPYFPTFFALRRHLGRCNIHTNSQALGRVWDKLREQSDIYIVCRWSVVLFRKIVIQKITLYDLYASAEKRIKPCRVTVPLFSTPSARMQARVCRDNYANTHGNVQNKILFYLNNSNYDTHHFKKLLEVEKDEEKNLNSTT